MIKKWTDKEIKLLKYHYKDKGCKYVAEKLGRSCESVRRKAVSLGLRYGGVRRWEVWEDRFLKRHYHSRRNASLGRTIKRSEGSVMAHANKLKLTNPKPKNWSEEEKKILRELYPDLNVSIEYIAKCVNRSTEAVLAKAQRLNIYRKTHIWTEEEHLYFINNWNSKTYKEIAQDLKVSYEAVRHHVASLKLKKHPTARPWTELEKEFIRRNYNVIPRTEIAQLLNRSVDVVNNLAGKLGLRSPTRRWSEEEKDFLKENYGILSREEIAAKLGRTTNAVRYAEKVVLKILTYFLWFVKDGAG